MEQSIFPSSYDGDAQLLLAIGMAVIGFLVIFLMERFANSKKNRIEKT
jgi:putative membrane protein